MVHFFRQEQAASATEYGVLVGIIAMVALTSTVGLDDAVNFNLTESAKIIQSGGYQRSSETAPQWQMRSTEVDLANPYETYALQLRAIDPQEGAVTYSLQSGALPEWMQLTNSGLLYGSGTWSESYTATFRAEDSNSEFADFTITFNPVLPKRSSCKAHYDSGVRVSGFYEVDPDGTGPTSTLTVWCDMKEDGGGWTLVSRGFGADGPSGWSTSSGINASGVKTPEDEASFKYSDAVINQLTTGAPEFRVQTDYFGNAKIFWQGVSYRHLDAYEGTDCLASVGSDAGPYSFGSCTLDSQCSAGLFRSVTAYRNCSDGYFSMNYDSSGWRIGDNAGSNCAAGQLGCDYNFWVR